MTPNRRGPAYALFARRPIVPQPPDVLAADPPASQEPPPPSGTEDTPVTECPLPAPAAAASAPTTGWRLHRYPAAQQIRNRRHQRQRWSIRPMVLVFPAGGSKSEGNISTAHGGVARKF
jgi:hypothetical protein